MERVYRVCDVFTEEPLQGNALAVFEDAGGLTDGQMQAMAREMNLSETTFVVRRDAETERVRGVKVRIFTVQEELPFAGHPSLGSAAMIRRYLPGYAAHESIVLDLAVGQVPVRFEPSKNVAEGNVSFGEMTQRDPECGRTHDPETVAPLLGLCAGDLAAQSPIQTWSTGLPYAIVPLASVEALGRLRVNIPESAGYLAKTDAKFFYCVARESETTWRARMQFYNGEDPATGSAAGCAISYFAHHGLAEPDAQVLIRQGIEMGRPGAISVRAKKNGDRVEDVRVGGSTVSVATGRFFL